MKHINSLDGARGVAALAIVVGHYFEEFSHADHGSRVFYASSFLGSFAVGVFFLISGFVIPGSIEHAGLARFAVRRVLRLYPVVVACALLKFAILLLGGYLPADGASVAILLKSMTLFGNIVLWNEQNIEPIFWTVMIEAKFYVVVACVFCLARRQQGRSHPILVAGLFAMTMLERFLPAPTLPWLSDLDVALSTMPMLLAGWFVWLHRQGTIGASGLVAGLAGCVAVLGMAPYPIYVSLDKGAPSWVLAFAVFVLLLRVRVHGDALAGRVTLFLGSISFPLYAIHPTLILIMERHNTGNLVLDLLLYVASVLLLAWLIHVVIESPFIRISQRLVRRKAAASRVRPGPPPSTAVLLGPGS